jgi:Ion transport protein
MPRMAAIGMITSLFFYIFAVMFTQLFGSLYASGDTEVNYFGTLGWTIFTLFEMMTLDNWASITRQVMETYTWAWMPIIAFVVMTGFIVANLIIAVICDAIGSIGDDEKARLHGGRGGGGGASGREDQNKNETNDADASATPAAGGGSGKQRVEIWDRLEALEDQIEELTRIQARTFHTLQNLTQQIEIRRDQQKSNCMVQ